MLKNMPKRGIVMIVAVLIAWAGVWVTPALAKPALVEVTGQTTSSADGDDGDIQAGVPFPTPRFSDKKDGTVKDNLTNLIWLKDASCLGPQAWEASGPTFPALAAVAALNVGTISSCVDYTAGTFTDWRLPNVKELQSLIDFGFVNPALSNAAGTGQCTATDCAFSGVPSAGCWSSTTFADRPDLAWAVSLPVGRTLDVGKGNTFLVWPVRGGE